MEMLRSRDVTVHNRDWAAAPLWCTGLSNLFSHHSDQDDEASAYFLGSGDHVGVDDPSAGRKKICCEAHRFQTHRFQHPLSKTGRKDRPPLASTPCGRDARVSMAPMRARDTGWSGRTPKLLLKLYVLAFGARGSLLRTSPGTTRIGLGRGFESTLLHYQYVVMVVHHANALPSGCAPGQL